MIIDLQRSPLIHTDLHRSVRRVFAYYTVLFIRGALLPRTVRFCLRYCFPKKILKLNLPPLLTSVTLFICHLSTECCDR